MTIEKRPWGWYEVLLDADDCKVKRIGINPKQRPSYQSHQHRAETWVIISGTGIVTINDGNSVVCAGDTVEIKLGDKHRIYNQSDSDPLVFIEVQRGTYFGEDDIVRIEDDYGRE